MTALLGTLTPSEFTSILAQILEPVPHHLGGLFRGRPTDTADKDSGRFSGNICIRIKFRSESDWIRPSDFESAEQPRFPRHQRHRG